MKYLPRFLTKFIVWFWFFRRKVPLLNLPFLWYLRFGGVFLIYPDEMGLNIFLSWRNNESSYELGEGRFLSRFIDKGMVCCDVGANQGTYSILFSKKSGNFGKVFAFEPVVSECKKLEINLKLNRCKNVKIENFALGSKKSLSKFYVATSGHASRSAFAVPTSSEVKGSISCEMVKVSSLDLYCAENNIKEIDIIKIDTEGSELDILRGSEALFLDVRPFVLIELADIATRQLGYGAGEIIEYLKSKNYSLWEFSLSGLLKEFQYKESYRQNLFAVPVEKEQKIAKFRR